MNARRALGFPRVVAAARRRVGTRQGIVRSIVTIFRDTPGSLKVGAPISFAVSCMQPEDLVPVGSTIWTMVEDLQQARYIEAYLTGEPEGFRPELDQTRINPRPSEAPQFPVD